MAPLERVRERGDLERLLVQVVAHARVHELRHLEQLEQLHVQLQRVVVAPVRRDDAARLRAERAARAAQAVEVAEQRAERRLDARGLLADVGDAAVALDEHAVVVERERRDLLLDARGLVAQPLGLLLQPRDALRREPDDVAAALALRHGRQRVGALTSSEDPALIARGLSAAHRVLCHCLQNFVTRCST